ncbi:hypothetical protein CBLAS_1548 [Campylobacter blaseri]|uniref:Uncharacterized protein n=1 Tax=Campylobacter blaseri TaxID=2042961 RepID=A0A2P8QZE8_9BACT|nr:hypothetical protein [Campylobacter blaseri]PSM51619.1 hypothetical protein CQ405_07435 [Campylobacter blaseri]PSM53412.1 hypothetical protein CRN67_07440 [Campylobacter blaseri]QKF86709.1 hypothetical protein CBLAS_1548 [Campylobacter blaseri]
MKNLPIIKSIDNLQEIQDKFCELISDDIDKIVEKMSENHTSRLLTMFEKTLIKNDDRLELLNDDYFKMTKEDSYLKFILEVFRQNDKNCIVNTNLFNVGYEYFLDYLNIGIDRKFQYLLLHQYMNFYGKNCSYFCVEDEEILKLLFTFILRENLVINYFLFPKDEICLISNYDCSFPIYFKDKSLVFKYSDIANENELYLI